MDIKLLHHDELTPEHWAAWSKIQRANPALESPYFRPEFTQAVAAVRDDVEVAVLSQSDGPVGFFPFHRDRRNVANSVGLWMSDYQGVIVCEDVDWNAEDLVRACGLAAWDFKYLIASQAPMQQHHYFLAQSVYMDLSTDFKDYRAGRPHRGHKRIKDIQRKGRKLDREVGPLRLECQVSDPQVLDQLLDWKIQQFRRTKVPNVLASKWTVELVKQTFAQQEEAFQGLLIGLYAGDHLVAADLSLRSFDILHGWFTAYDPALGRYSPGMVMHVEFAKHAQSLGVRRKDLGKGEGQHKHILMSGGVPIAEGSVACQPLAKAVRETRRGLRGMVRSTPLRGAAQSVARNYYWLRGRIGQVLHRQETPQ